MDQYWAFLDARAARLAEEANMYLQKLSNGSPEDARPSLKLAVANSIS
jgi:hypothetical protein